MNSVMMSIPTLHQRPIATRTMCAYDALMSKYFHTPSPLERCGLTVEQVRSALEQHDTEPVKPVYNPYPRADRKRKMKPIDDRVLEVIRDNEGAVTSDQLVDTLGLSRIAVGRCISRLIDRGHHIVRIRDNGNAKSTNYYMI